MYLRETLKGASVTVDGLDFYHKITNTSSWNFEISPQCLTDLVVTKNKIMKHICALVSHEKVLSDNRVCVLDATRALTFHEDIVSPWSETWKNRQSMDWIFQSIFPVPLEFSLAVVSASTNNFNDLLLHAWLNHIKKLGDHKVVLYV